MELYPYGSGRCVRLLDELHRVKLLLSRSRALSQVLGAALFELPDYVFLAADLILLLVVRAQISFPELALFLCVRRIIPVVYPQLVILYLEYAACDLIKEITVVRYDHDRSAVAFQKLLEPLQHADVEVVRRLVQKQDVRLLHEEAGQR